MRLARGKRCPRSAETQDLLAVALPAVGFSLERLNKIIAVDALNHTMTVEAGCVLANIQKRPRMPVVCFR